MRWGGRLPTGLTLLCGATGAGKTALCASVVSRVTRGVALEDDDHWTRPHNVLWLGAKNRHAEVRDQVRAAGATSTRVYWSSLDPARIVPDFVPPERRLGRAGRFAVAQNLARLFGFCGSVGLLQEELAGLPQEQAESLERLLVHHVHHARAPGRRGAGPLRAARGRSGPLGAARNRSATCFLTCFALQRISRGTCF